MTSQQKTFTKKLNKLFEIHKLNSSQVVELSGISPGYLSQLRTGSVTNPTLDIIKKLAKCFQVSPAYFFDEEEIEEQTDDEQFLEQVALRSTILSPKAKKMALNMFLEIVDHIHSIEKNVLDGEFITDFED